MLSSTPLGTSPIATPPLRLTPLLREAREPSENWELIERWDGWEIAFIGKHHTEASLRCMKYCDVGLIENLLPPLNYGRFLSLIGGVQVFLINYKREKRKKLYWHESTAMFQHSWCLESMLLPMPLIPCPNLVYRGSSGKVFPWAIPPFEHNVYIYDRIWGTLKDEVWKAFVALEVLQYDRRESGSDGGLDHD